MNKANIKAINLFIIALILSIINGFISNNTLHFIINAAWAVLMIIGWVFLAFAIKFYQKNK